MQKSIFFLWYMAKLIGLVKPIMTKELIKTIIFLKTIKKYTIKNKLLKTIKIFLFGSQPFAIEQWFTGQERKLAKM